MGTIIYQAAMLKVTSSSFPSPQGCVHRLALVIPQGAHELHGSSINTARDPQRETRSLDEQDPADPTSSDDHPDVRLSLTDNTPVSDPTTENPNAPNDPMAIESHHSPAPASASFTRALSPATV